MNPADSTVHDRAFYSGKHKRHGVNVQVLADSVGRLVWASPALPGSRHDMGAAREHGLIDGLARAGVRVVADTACRGGGAAIQDPQRRRRLDADTGRYRLLSVAQKQVNAAHARHRGPGERANAQLKSWQVLRKIRSCPGRATAPVKTVGKGSMQGCGWANTRGTSRAASQPRKVRF